jgi:CDP-ribitol ribitolphosphotransferase
MRKITATALSAGVGVLNGIYALLKLAPVKKKITLISRQSDTPSIDFRLIEDAIHDKHPDYQVVTLAKTDGNKLAFAFHMLKQMRHLATSKAVLIDSYCIAVSVLKHKPSLQVIQLWHAMGSMKQFGYALIGTEHGTDPEIARIFKMHHGYDKILISSKSFLKDYEEGFQMDPAIVEEIPLPKADLLADPSYRSVRRSELLKKYPELSERKNILYCPTFRKHPVADTKEKVSALIDAAHKAGYNLLYKPHPVSDLDLSDCDFLNIPEDSFDLFFVSDYVISDYSSIIYEAGLAEIPVFLYAYDWDAYQEEHKLNIDLQHDSPLLFTDDPKKIIKAIETDDFDYDAFTAFIHDNVKMPDHGSCLDAILDLLKL